MNAPLPIPPIQTVPDELIQAINSRLRMMWQSTPSPVAAPARVIQAAAAAPTVEACASVTLIGQTSAISATSLLVNLVMAPAGMYRLTGYFVVTVQGTGSAVITIAWHDGVVPHSFGAFGGALSGVVGTYVQSTLNIRADGAHNIQYAASYTGGGGAAYDFYLVVEKLNP